MCLSIIFTFATQQKTPARFQFNNLILGKCQQWQINPSTFRTGAYALLFLQLSAEHTQSHKEILAASATTSLQTILTFLYRAERLLIVSFFIYIPGFFSAMSRQGVRIWCDRNTQQQLNCRLAPYWPLTKHFFGMTQGCNQPINTESMCNTFKLDAEKLLKKSRSLKIQEYPQMGFLKLHFNLFAELKSTSKVFKTIIPIQVHSLCF